ncbi:MAG: DNA polymerase III subunit delta [Acidobacteriota bacterium]|jgi:DNA polymerase-3 subunit delta|nr:DNA polymerase III subunit delta [Acidobacteriota bacterium]
MILQTLEELEKDLAAAIRPVYLVLGPEEYHCDQALAILKSRVMTPGAADFDYSVFAANNASVAEILEAANIYPMLSKRRLVVVEDAGKFKEAETDALLEGLASISPRSTVILTAVELDKRKKVYKTFQKDFCICEFPRLKGFALERWANDFMRKSGYRISADALKRVVDIAGADLRTLASEFEKLTLYAGEEKNIPDAVIEDLVRASRQQSIFDLTNAVGRRDRVGALRSLGNLLGMGEHPLVVVTMLARHCRQTLIAIEGLRERKNPRDIASEAQIPPFAAEQFLAEARAVKPDTVRNMYIRLAAIDRQLKSSSLDGRAMIEGLICEFV